MSIINENIPDGWMKTSLEQVCLPKGGKRLPKGETLTSVRNNHPYIRITDFDGNSINKSNLQFVPEKTFDKISRYIVNEGDIIISIVGTIGLVALIDKDLDNASLTENCVKLTKLEGVNNIFLYYFLISKYGQYEIDINAVGAVQKKLPIYGVENINIFLPSLLEQKAIANILTAFDDKIENLQAQNKTLETTAQTIFKEWFGKYQVGDELPDGWRVGKLGEEFNIIMGQSPSGSSYNEEGNGTVFFQGRAEFTSRFPEIRLFTTEPKRMANKYDVLVSVRAPVGDINVAHTNCCIGRGLATVSSVYKSYALYKLKNLKPIFDLFESEGTVFGSINKTSFETIETIIPEIKKVQEFDSISMGIDIKIYNNYNQIQTLKKNRDTLLPKLMSGQLRVKMSEL